MFSSRDYHDAVKARLLAERAKAVNALVDAKTSDVQRDQFHRGAVRAIGHDGQPDRHSAAHAAR